MDGIIYDTTDGCSKQYRYENAMWLLYVLEFTHRVIIYRYINAPGHSIRKMFTINGAGKKHLKTNVNDKHRRI